MAQPQAAVSLTGMDMIKSAGCNACLQLFRESQNRSERGFRFPIQRA